MCPAQLFGNKRQGNTISSLPRRHPTFHLQVYGHSEGPLAVNFGSNSATINVEDCGAKYTVPIKCSFLQ